jgi:alkylhydroperoxidase/carboxymuconolactone decarboxylase family protein YurZ
MDQESITQQETKKEDLELREPSPQPNLNSYYGFIEGGKAIPQNFFIPLFFELEKERAKTQRWMQIAKSKGVENVGHMEEKLKEMGRELSNIRDKEAMMEAQLEAENAWLRGKLQERERQLAAMASLSLEAIQCKMPAKSYALYLKEQWLQFQIKTLAQRGIMPFQDYRQFINLYDQSTLEDRAKMSEFYIHNLALTYLNVWGPNSKLRDLQLMALASWMNHEEARATEMKKVMAREEIEPLMIRVEQSNPIVVISTHNLIANDPNLAPRYLVAQEQAVTHFEDMFRLLGDDSTQACQRRWNNCLTA